MVILGVTAVSEGVAEGEGEGEALTGTFLTFGGERERWTRALWLPDIAKVLRELRSKSRQWSELPLSKWRSKF